jgi:hypothetical protein
MPAASGLAELGPQLPAESGLPARIRFHQSWYRRLILGRAAFGAAPAYAGGRALGSILSAEDADAGLNFVTQSAKSLFTWRRRQGWAVDPVRCTSYLTSSQALTLNLFGPLRAAPAWASRVLSVLLSIEVHAPTDLILPQGAY